MIILTNPSTLELVLGSSVTTSQLPYYIAYVDSTSTTHNPLQGSGVSNDTTIVTMLSTPVVATTRTIKYISIHNKDTTSKQIFIQINDTVNTRTLVDFTLDAGDRIEYTDTVGFRVISSLGEVKTVSTGNSITQTPWTSNINAAGYTLFGDSSSGGTLTLSSTSNATKGKILFGTSAYDEVNNRLGIGVATPLHALDVQSSTQYSRFRGTLGGGLLIGSFSSYEGAIWNSSTTPTTSNYMFLCSGGYTLFNADIEVHFRTTNITKMVIANGGNVGIGITTPTAVLHLKAGTATAGTAPLKLTSGINLTTPENGTFEFDGTNLYFTVGGVRKTIQLL